MRHKTEIIIEIDLIYNLKLNSNIIGRKIRIKTQFLTKDSAQIHPISHKIICFSFRKFEDGRWRSRIDFSLFSLLNFTFKHSLDVKMSLEVKGSKRFKDCGV